MQEELYNLMNQIQEQVKKGKNLLENMGASKEEVRRFSNKQKFTAGYYDVNEFLLAYRSAVEPSSRSERLQETLEKHLTGELDPADDPHTG